MTRAAPLVIALAMTAGGACGIDWTVPKPKPDAGEAGAGGVGGAPGPTASSADKAESASSGKPTGCDQSGDCAACVQCAQGECAQQIEQCTKSQPCNAIARCALGCTDSQGQADCVDKCIQETPDGAKEFDLVLDCVVCSICPGDCKELAIKYCGP